MITYMYLTYPQLSLSDIAKTINRVSSDTDNETDRLLGTQRTDQLKLAGQEMDQTGDQQHINQSIKTNPSSREGKLEGETSNRLIFLR